MLNCFAAVWASGLRGGCGAGGVVANAIGNDPNVRDLVPLRSVQCVVLVLQCVVLLQQLGLQFAGAGCVPGVGAGCGVGDGLELIHACG